MDNGVVVAPRSMTGSPVKRTKYKKTIRPIYSAALKNIGQVLADQKWKFMDPTLSSTSLTELFENYTMGILDIFCPQKVVYLRPDQKPFITEEMKILKRRTMREYEKRGKSNVYLNMKKCFAAKYEGEANKYKQKIIDDVLSGERNSA